MANLTTFQHYHNPQSDTLAVVLHGGSYSIGTPFIQKAFDVCRKKGHSTIAFNFPYRERGEENTSGPGLVEELETLQKFLDYCEYEKYKHIRLLGKSLGAIVASFYLSKLPEDKIDKFSIVVLGYVTGHVKLQNFTGPVAIIQGEKDKFGDIKAVRKDLKNAKSKDIQYFEISGADHSFRDPETKEPVFEDSAMKVLSSLLL